MKLTREFFLENGQFLVPRAAMTLDDALAYQVRSVESVAVLASSVVQINDRHFLKAFIKQLEFFGMALEGFDWAFILPCEIGRHIHAYMNGHGIQGVGIQFADGLDRWVVHREFIN